VTHWPDFDADPAPTDDDRMRKTYLAFALLTCSLLVVVCLQVAAHAEPPPTAAGGELPPQTILPPGLYLFQTRTRDGTCDDAPRTGYVTSAVATLDGVPGSRKLTLQLLNSKYWPTWSLTVNADDAVVGDANMGGAADDSGGTSHFELHEKKGRYQGVGTRSYPNKSGKGPARCTLNYDALLKALD
jgi:hypothetical protein